MPFIGQIKPRTMAVHGLPDDAPDDAEPVFNLVFADGPNRVTVGPFTAEEWVQVVEVITDPKAAEDAAAARTKIVMPDGTLH